MAGPYDFTGQNIENTYQRVLQTPDGITFYDGTGSLVNIGGGAGTPGGPNTSIQFNNNGAFSGSANFTFNSASDTLILTGSQNISGSISASYGANTVGFYGTASWAVSASQTISSSYSTTASYALNGGVTQLLAGPNITLSPINGLGQVTVSSTGAGIYGNTATGSYGSFYSTQTQTSSLANTSASMFFDQVDISNGVSISGSISSSIKITNAGVYNIQFSAQLARAAGSGTENVLIWLRKNGTDLSWTNTSVTFAGGTNVKQVAAWNWFANVAAGDYYEIMWQTTSTNIIIEATTIPEPDVPSVILTVNRIDQFLSNTGSFTGSFTGQLIGTASWASQAISASWAPTIPGGLDTQIQFNSGSSLHGSPYFKYSYTLDSLQQGYGSISGNFSHAEGGPTQAIGNFSHAEGVSSKAIGEGSHAEGNDTRTGTINAYYADPVSSGVMILSSLYGDKTGYFATDGDLFLYDLPFSANYNRAVFKISQSYYNGTNTVVELYDTTVTTAIAYVGNITANPLIWDGDQIIPANTSHTEGNQTITLNDHTHAEGLNTIAVGAASHAEGYLTYTSGAYSHAEGLGTITNANYQHVQGQYNMTSSIESAFIVGNGTNSINRSNLIHAAGTLVEISGSLSINGGITGSLLGTASWSDNTITASYAQTSSYASIANSVNDLNQNVIVSGSLTITQNLTVLGSSSITHITSSQLNIGTNLITVNTNTPGVRFGGLAVIDSGSSPQVSGSFLFDSQKNQYIFIHQGATVTSSVFLLGPETYNNIGNETYLTQNRLPKGSGIEHLYDSNISDTGTVVSINSNSEITGSLKVTAGITGSLLGTASTASYVNGSRIKNNAISSGTFTGNPKKATVTFSSAYPDTNYSITITGEDARTWTIESKLAGSFVINSNSNTALAGTTYWQTMNYGEFNS